MKKRHKFEYKTDMGMVEYLTVVEGIAVDYFDDDDNYTPHVGRLNAMRIFYNKFVTNCKFDESHPHDITDVLQMEDIVADYDFIEAFNKAISPTAEKFDFANAYADAMEIVEYRKYALTSAVDKVKRSINEIADKFSGLTSDDTIAAVSKIASAMQDGNISVDALAAAVVDAYGKSNRMQEVIHTKNDNVVPITKA